MLVPGVRIVRGPDWSWDNQGKKEHNQNILLKEKSLSRLLALWNRF